MIDFAVITSPMSAESRFTVQNLSCFQDIAVAGTQFKELEGLSLIHLYRLKGKASRVFPFVCYRIKFVRSNASGTGGSIPACRPASMDFSSQAMFLPRVRMICSPSRSCATSSGVFP